jgi:hypothetical protein
VRRIAPQQYRIAVQQDQAIPLMGIAAMRSERRFAEKLQFPYVLQRLPGDATFPKRNSAARGMRPDTGVFCILQCKKPASHNSVLAALQKRRPPVGGLSLGRKRPRRACTVNTVRVIVWRQIPQMQDLSTDFELHVPPCDVFATARQTCVLGVKPILWFNQ